MPQAILFDLDSTIIANNATSSDCWRGICQRFINRLPGFEADQLYSEIRKSGDSFWSDPERHRSGRLNLYSTRRLIVSKAFDVLNINDGKLTEELADTYTVEREESMKLVPGAIETLTHFRNIGHKLALVTNGASEFQRAKIDRFNLAPFFHHILVEGEFGHGKPEKQVFISVLEKLDTKPDDAWMVGDDLERDIAGANNAGVFSIWVDREGKGLLENSPVIPDRIIRSITELV